MGAWSPWVRTGLLEGVQTMSIHLFNYIIYILRGLMFHVNGEGGGQEAAAVTLTRQTRKTEV